MRSGKRLPSIFKFVFSRGLSHVEFLEDTYSPSISRILKFSYWKGERDRNIARRPFHSIQKVDVANFCLPLGLYTSDGHAIVSSISQKPLNWLQPREGKQCCKFGLLYSMDGFMLLLQDKLQ